MTPELTRTGIGVLGDVPWGLHFSLFYETQDDLLDAIVPYFAAGLEAGELCVWAPSEPTLERAAHEALRARIPNLDAHLARRSFESFRYEDFFKPDGRLDSESVLVQLRRWERRVHDEGYAGLRGGGNLVWVKRDSWESCHRYERSLRDFVIGRRAMVLCCYPLDRADAADILDSAREHHLVVARRRGDWEVVETPALTRSKEELQRVNAELEQRAEERSAQLSAANEGLRREIEERRRVEAELRMSEAYLRHAQRLSHTGSFADSSAGFDTTFWSEETYRIFGLEPRAHPPGRDEIFSLVHPKDRARLSVVMDDMAATRHGCDVEFRVVRPDGSIRHVRAVSSAVTDEARGVTELVGTIIDITEQRRAAAKLARVTREARERTLRAGFAAAFEERTRLARDIHDTLLQGVTGIALQLRATLPKLGGAPRATIDAIRQIVELAESTVREARRAVWDIRAPTLAQNGLATALEDEVRRRANGVGVRFEVRGVPRRTSPAVEDTVFRVGQEAVMNAARHSGAGAITVRLAYEPQALRLTIEDDGRGFEVDPLHRGHGGHLGLLGMRERADRIGAPLVVRSAEGAGTTIELFVPVTQATADAAPSRRRSSSAIGTTDQEIVVHADTRADR